MSNEVSMHDPDPNRTDSGYVLWKCLLDKAEEKKYPLSYVKAFLSLCLTGTMEMNGSSQEFFDATLQRMREDFRRKRKERDATKS